jgi:RNase H-fold protein (predicted Holliday junction resolvase)
MGGVAIPLPPETGGGWAALERRLAGAMEEFGFEKVVLGLPLSAAGRPTELSSEVEGLARRLRELGYEVVLLSEVGSTAEARALPGRRRRRSGKTDSLAALIILERYLAAT